EVRDRGVSSRYRVHNISCVARHVEVGVPTLRAQPGIVGRDHGIAEHDVFVEALPVVEQRSHEGWSTVVGDSACAVRPSQQGPSASGRLAIWNQYDAGLKRVRVASSSGVIENSDGPNTGRQRKVGSWLRANQGTWLGSSECLFSVKRSYGKCPLGVDLFTHLQRRREQVGASCHCLL